MWWSDSISWQIIQITVYKMLCMVENKTMYETILNTEKKDAVCLGKLY
jgi:hypothetical protein